MRPVPRRQELIDILEDIRRAEQLVILHLRGTPEHAEAVVRLADATRRLASVARDDDGHPVTHDPTADAARAAPGSRPRRGRTPRRHGLCVTYRPGPR
jgi:hypothetical protein